MINRELREATLISYDDTVDEYGQTLTHPSGRKKIYISFGILNHSHVDDIRYNAVTHYGLTRDTVNDSQTIEIDGKAYKIVFVNPHKRVNEVLLCQK